MPTSYSQSLTHLRLAAHLALFRHNAALHHPSYTLLTVLLCLGAVVALVAGGLLNTVGEDRHSVAPVRQLFPRLSGADVADGLAA